MERALKKIMSGVCAGLVSFCALMSPAHAQAPEAEDDYLADFLFGIQSRWTFSDETTAEAMDFTVLDGRVIIRSEISDPAGDHLGLACIRAGFDKYGRLSEPGVAHLNTDIVISARTDEGLVVLDTASAEMVVKRMVGEGGEASLSVRLGDAEPVIYVEPAKLELLQFAEALSECRGIFEYAMPETDAQRAEREQQRNRDHYRMILEADLLRGSH